MIELRERIGNLSPEKRKQLELLLTQRAAKAPPQETISRTAEGPHRLSFAQERLWFVEQLEPADAAYNLAWALRLKGALDTEGLHRALNAIMARQDALRTAFCEIEGVPYQFVQPPRAVEMRRLDLTGDPHHERINAALS